VPREINATSFFVSLVKYSSHSRSSAGGWRELRQHEPPLASRNILSLRDIAMCKLLLCPNLVQDTIKRRN
jgi:hypothetical protein